MLLRILKSEHVNLSLANCANISTNVVKNSEYYDRPKAKEFIAVYMYIKKDSSLSLGIPKALALAEEIVTSSPGAGENFRLAYEFGVYKKGMNFTAKKALGFVIQLKV